MKLRALASAAAYIQRATQTIHAFAHRAQAEVTWEDAVRLCDDRGLLHETVCSGWLDSCLVLDMDDVILMSPTRPYNEA